MMMWVRKYDTVILKITIHTGFTKQGLQNTISIYWRNKLLALLENIRETQINACLERVYLRLYFFLLTPFSMGRSLQR